MAIPSGRKGRGGRRGADGITPLCAAAPRSTPSSTAPTRTQADQAAAAAAAEEPAAEPTAAVEAKRAEQMFVVGTTPRTMCIESAPRRFSTRGWSEPDHATPSSSYPVHARSDILPLYDFLADLFAPYLFPNLFCTQVRSMWDPSHAAPAMPFEVSALRLAVEDPEAKLPRHRARDRSASHLALLLASRLFRCTDRRRLRWR